MATHFRLHTGKFSRRQRRPPSGMRVVAAGLVIAGGLLVGCAHYHAKPLNAKNPASSVIHGREANGLYVAVENLAAGGQSRTYFDRDLIEYGYVPVLIQLEMAKNEHGSFEVHRNDIELCLNTGTRLHPVDPDEISALVAFSHWRTVFGFVPLLLPGPFVLGSVNEANRQLRVDYQTKSLQSVRVTPNSPQINGVVFFSLPDELRAGPDMSDAFVEMKVYKQGKDGQRGRVMDLAVHFFAE